MAKKLRARGRWGNWRFKGDTFVLRGPAEYEFDFDRCQDSAGILDQIIQTLQKGWMTDKDMVHLASFSEIWWLDLGFQTELSDAGIAHLRHLKKLQSLILNDTSVSDAGLARIGNLSSLRTLVLDDTQISDNGHPREFSLGRSPA